MTETHPAPLPGPAAHELPPPVPHVPDDAPPPGGVTLRQAFVVLVLVALYLVAVAGAVVGLHLSGLVEVSGATLPLVLLGLSVAPVLALHLHLVRRYRLSGADLGFRRPTWRLLHLLWQMPLAVLAGALTQGAVTVATTGGTAVPDRGPSVLDELASRSAAFAVLVLVAVAVVTPLWEEVLFRGAILGGFLRRCGPGMSALLTATVFAACHGFPPTMPYLFVIGLALAWVRLSHANLWASVIMHAVNNALVTAIALSAL